MTPKAIPNLSLPWDLVGNLIKGTTVSLPPDADEAAGDQCPCCSSGCDDFTHLSWAHASQICALCNKSDKILLLIQISKDLPFSNLSIF